MHFSIYKHFLSTICTIYLYSQQSRFRLLSTQQAILCLKYYLVGCLQVVLLLFFQSNFFYLFLVSLFLPFFWYLLFLFKKIMSHGAQQIYHLITLLRLYLIAFLLLLQIQIFDHISNLYVLQHNCSQSWLCFLSIFQSSVFSSFSVFFPLFQALQFQYSLGCSLSLLFIDLMHFGRLEISCMFKLHSLNFSQLKHLQLRLH